MHKNLKVKFRGKEIICKYMLLNNFNKSVHVKLFKNVYLYLGLKKKRLLAFFDSEHMLKIIGTSW